LGEEKGKGGGTNQPSTTLKLSYSFDLEREGKGKKGKKRERGRGGAVEGGEEKRRFLIRSSVRAALASGRRPAFGEKKKKKRKEKKGKKRKSWEVFFFTVRVPLGRGGGDKGERKGKDVGPSGLLQSSKRLPKKGGGKENGGGE